MRTLLLTAAALIATGPAQAAQYGAQYSDQGSGAWQDVPPVQLNVPAQASPATASSSDWHDHADRADVRGPGDRAWHDRADWRGADRGEHGAGSNYRRAERGWTIPHYWMSPGYAVTNWDFYGLGNPGYGRHWVRYYDDAVLVDDRGTVIDSVGDLDWDRPASPSTGRYAASGTYGYGARYGGQAVGSNYAPPAYPQYSYAPPAAGYAPPSVTSYAGPGYAMTTIVQSAPVVTTTTTTTYVDEVATQRVVRAAPRRVWHRPRRITCCCRC